MAIRFFSQGGAKLPMFLQSEMAECGLACLAMIGAFYGHDVNLMGLRRRFRLNARGTNLKQLIEIANQLHLNARPLKAEMSQLQQLQVPCILHWDMEHFVVLRSVQADRFVIHDPGFGIRHLKADELSRHFTGIALELSPSQQFKAIREKSRLGLGQLFSQSQGVKRGFAQVLLLSFLLMALTISLPLIAQLVFDDALGTFDSDILTLLILALLAATLFRGVTACLRGYFLLFLGNSLSFHAGASIFRQLLHLPLGYFEKRHMGDLVSRFSSVDQIKRFLTEGMMEVVVDGFMSVLMLGLMLFYSISLSLFSFMAVALYGLLRLVLFRSFRQLSEEAILSQASEHTHFMESLRGIQSVKLYGGESDRHSVWQNLYARVLNANTALGRFRVGFQSFQDLLFGCARAAVLYWGVLQVMEHQLSVGMLIAFLAYQDQFVEKIKSLVENLMQFKMLDLHLDRIADIVLEKPDFPMIDPCFSLPTAADITCRDIAFRFDEQSPWLFRNLHFTIRAGESLAIVGPSGCGKTTLLKVLVGLFPATEGSILIGDQNLGDCRRTFQRKVGTVMQDDHLLSGTIADNIAFFDAAPDWDRVRACAAMACIDKDIEKLPMRYHSLIGGTGTVLSGGQRQRILLARALYRQPDFLFLDEATSHLDQAVESTVNAAIRELKMTRVIIAHRLETILSADRILMFKDQELVEIEAAAYCSVFRK